MQIMDILLFGQSFSSNGDMIGINKGGYDGIIVKYDLDGNIEWKKTFGGTNSDYFHSIVNVNNGYIAVRFF